MSRTTSLSPALHATSSLSLGGGTLGASFRSSSIAQADADPRSKAVFTDKLHTYLRRVSSQLDVLHKRCDELDRLRTETIPEVDSRLTRMCKDTDTKFTAKTNDNSQIIQQHFEMFTDLCSTLDEKINQKFSQLDEKFTLVTDEHGGQIAENRDTVRTHYNHFESTCRAMEADCNMKFEDQGHLIDENHRVFTEALNKVDREMKDKTERLDVKFTEMGKAQDERIELLNTTTVQHHAHFTEICTKLDKKHSERNAALEQMIKSHRAEVAHLCTRLDDKFSAENAAQDERLEGMHRHFTDVSAYLDKKFTEDSNAMDEKLSLRCDRLDTKFSEAIEEQERLMSEHFTRSIQESAAVLDAKIVDLTSALEMALSEKTSKLDRKFTETVADQADRMRDNHKQLTEACSGLEQRLTDETVGLDEKFTNACSKLERWISERIKMQDERMDSEHRNFIDVCQNLQRNLTAGLSECEQKAAHATRALELKNADEQLRLSDRIEGENKHFSNICAALDQKLTDAVVVQQNVVDRVGDNGRQLQLLMDKMGEQVTRMDSDYQHFTEVCTTMATKQDSDAATLDGKFTEIVNHLEARFSAKNEKQDELMNAGHEQLTGMYQTLHTDLRAEIGNMGKTLGDAMAGQEDSLEKLTRSVDSHYDFFSGSCADLDRRLTEDIGAAQQQTERQLSTLAVAHDQAQLDTGARMGSMEKNFSDKAASQDERVDGLSRNLAQQGMKMTDALMKVDQKVTNQLTEVRQVLDEHQSTFAATTADMMARFTTDISTQAERVDSEHAHFTTLCSRIETSFEERLEWSTQQAVEATRRLEMRQEEQTNAVQARVDSEHTWCAGLCAKLDSKLTEDLALRSATLAEMCDALKANSETQFEEAGRAAHDTHAHFSGLCGELEQKLVAETEALVGSVGGLEARLIQESEASVARLHDSMQQVLHMCSQLEAKTASKQDALDAKFTDKTAAADDRLDGTVEALMKLGDDMTARIEQTSAAVEEGARAELGRVQQALGADLEAARLDATARAEETSAELGRVDTRLDSEIENTTSTLGGALIELQQKLATDMDSVSAAQTQLEANVESRLGTELAKVDATFASQDTSLKALEVEVRENVAAKMAQLEGQVEKTLQPLVQKSDALRTEMNAVQKHAHGSDEKLQGMKLTVGMEMDELKTGMGGAVNDLSEELTAVQENVDALGQQVEAAVAQLDIDGALMAMAKEAV